MAQAEVLLMKEKEKAKMGIIKGEELNDESMEECIETEPETETTDNDSDIKISAESPVDQNKEFSKPKWKMKIRVSGKSSETEDTDNSWEVVQKDASDTEKTNIDIDVVSVDHNTVSASMIDALSPTSLPAKRKIKKKSYDSKVFSTLTPPSKKTKGGLRSDCPPFCRTNCTYTHHPLLVCARRMIENDSSTTLMFIDQVSAHYGGDKDTMSPSDIIADPWRNTQFPLLHYIALMGKCSGCFAMMDVGHNPETVLTESGDTVLHTLIKEMYLFNCSHGHMDILLKKFTILLKEFKDCTVLPNFSGKTPLHVCCELISETSKLLCDVSRTKPPFRLYQFQKNMLLAILQQFKIDNRDISQLNLTDNNKNTFSHYLALDRASVELLEEIKEMGADFLICNNDSQDVNQVIDTAPPGPPRDVLELAAYSAKGQKYKSANKRPVTTTPKRNAKKPVAKSPNKTIIAKTVPTFSSPIKNVDVKAVSKRVIQVVDKNEQMLAKTPIPLYKHGKVRVKITPTRKEKQDLKIAKKIEKEEAKAVKENLVDNYVHRPLTVTEIGTSAHSEGNEIKPILVAISTTSNITSVTNIATTLTTSSSTVKSVIEATRKIRPNVVQGQNLSQSSKVVLLPVNSSAQTQSSIVAKIKPITVNSTPLEPSPTMLNRHSSKLDISSNIKSDIFASAQSTNVAINQMQQTFTKRMVPVTPAPAKFQHPMSQVLIRKTQPQSNSSLLLPASGENLMQKPIIVKTMDGKVLQLQTLPYQNGQQIIPRHGKQVTPQPGNQVIPQPGNILKMQSPMPQIMPRMPHPQSGLGSPPGHPHSQIQLPAGFMQRQIRPINVNIINNNTSSTINNTSSNRQCFHQLCFHLKPWCTKFHQLVCQFPTYFSHPSNHNNHNYIHQVRFNQMCNKCQHL